MSHARITTVTSAIKHGAGKAPGLLSVLALVPDPRKLRGRRYPLVFVLAVAAACTLAGARTFREIGDQAADLPQDVLRDLGGRPHPLLRKIIAPSETRIRTLAHAIDAGVLNEVIGGWLRELADAGRLDTLLTAIAIDGKWLRGVADGQVKLFAAMLHEEKVMIAQHRIPDETTETTQVKELLEPVDLAGAVVTADAAHAQRETANYIAGPEEDGGRGSDYFLFVKGNQPSLQKAVFDVIQDDGPRGPDHTELDYGHGRIIRRSIWVASAEGIDFPYLTRIARNPPRRLRHRRHPDQQGNRARGHQPGRRPCQRQPASPALPAASGVLNRCTGCATPPGPKTPIPDMPETALRSWPRCGISPSACSTLSASPRSPAPSRPSDATGPACSTTYRYEAGITNDFADPVVSYRELIGDHPVVPTRTITYDQPGIEVESLYIIDGQRMLYLLRPFVIGTACPKCRNWSTFHIDGIANRKVSFKSLEHGHPMEDPTLDYALKHVGLLLFREKVIRSTTSRSELRRARLSGPYGLNCHRSRLTSYAITTVKGTFRERLAMQFKRPYRRVRARLSSGPRVVDSPVVAQRDRPNLYFYAAPPLEMNVCTCCGSHESCCASSVRVGPDQHCGPVGADHRQPGFVKFVQAGFVKDKGLRLFGHVGAGRRWHPDHAHRHPQLPRAGPPARSSSMCLRRGVFPRTASAGANRRLGRTQAPDSPQRWRADTQCRRTVGGRKCRWPRGRSRPSSRGRQIHPDRSRRVCSYADLCSRDKATQHSRPRIPPVGRADRCLSLHAFRRRDGALPSTEDRPLAVSFQLVIDCADPEPLARFWAATSDTRLNRLQIFGTLLQDS